MRPFWKGAAGSFRLPPAVKVNRLELGAQRWAHMLHKKPIEFAAAMAEKVRIFDDAPSRENAKSAFRIAQAAGTINAHEMMTAIDTLAVWEGAEPGAKCAVMVAMIEISGGRNKDNELRVFSRKEYM